jgi:hypothetical protein
MNKDESPLNEKGKVTLQSQNQTERLLDVTTLPKKSHIEPLDTSVLDEQWAEMSQDWQSQPTTKTDIAKLLKQTKQRTFWAKCLLAIDIMATLGMLSVALYMWLSGSKDQATIIYLGMGGILSIVFVYFAIKIRLAAWKVYCGSPDKAIKHAIEAGQSSLSYIKLVKLSCFIIWPFAIWYVVAVAQQIDKSPLLGLVISNVFIVTVLFITHRFQLKRVEELKQLEGLL